MSNKEEKQLYEELIPHDIQRPNKRNHGYCIKLIVIMIICLSYLYLYPTPKPRLVSQPKSDLNTRISAMNYTSSYIINTQGCRIQNLNIYDPSVARCIYKDRPINCSKDNLSRLVKSTNNILYVDMKSIHEYNLTEDTIMCCYTPLWKQEFTPEEFRKDPLSLSLQTRFGKNCINFTRTSIQYEFVRVKCWLPNNTSYIDYFVFVQPDTTAPKIIVRDRNPSVLVIGIDSVSRLNFHRQMPMTAQFLKCLNAVEMLGYNKIGENTYPNVVAVLTGYTEARLISECHRNTEIAFDKCPFIWEKYSKNHYITGFGEDSPNIGTFQYNLPGFREKPTDFYLQPFHHVAESEIGHEKRLNTKLCFGKRLNVEVLLDAVKQFAINYKHQCSLGFFWGTSLTHDYLNLPKYGDVHYWNLLKELHDAGVFNSSIVILMSDHGIRWGAIRSTYQGYLEERLPFLFFVYPEWFAEKYPQAVRNLQLNRRRLTTPFDLHETLKDLVDLNNITNKAIQTRVYNSARSSRGTSLFLPISETRTCNDASIPKVWCTCHQSETVSTSDEFVKSSSTSVVSYLNKLLKGYVQCSRLYLNRIINARLERVPLSEQEKRIKKSSITDYTVTIETKPGLAMFEATVRYSGQTKSYTVMPGVSRINIYGNQSHCINDNFLKLFCFCLM